MIIIITSFHIVFYVDFIAFVIYWVTITTLYSDACTNETFAGIL